MKLHLLLVIAICTLGISVSTKATVEAIAVGLEGTNSYTVPMGKILLIEHITHRLSGGSIRLGEVRFSPSGSSQEFILHDDNSMAMKFPEGTTIHMPEQGPGAYCAFSGLLVDASDLYANRGKIKGMSVGNDMLTMHVNGPPGQRSQVFIESTYDLLGADWRREQEALVTQTAKGSSEFDIEIPIASADQTFYKARFRPKN